MGRIYRGNQELEGFSLDAREGAKLAWPVGGLPPDYWIYRTERVKLARTIVVCVTVLALFGVAGVGDMAAARELLETLKDLKEMFW